MKEIKGCENCDAGYNKIFDGIQSLYCTCPLGDRRKNQASAFAAASDRGGFEAYLELVMQTLENCELDSPVIMVGILRRDGGNVALSLFPEVLRGDRLFSKWTIRGSRVSRSKKRKA